MAMVITPRPLCSKKQQGRLNTRVSFESALPSKAGHFSVGVNWPGDHPGWRLAFSQARMSAGTTSYKSSMML